MPPGLGRALAFCVFALLCFPREEYFRLLVDPVISCLPLDSVAAWMTGTVPKVVAPRLSRGILLGGSVFLLADFSQPSTTLWDEVEPWTLGGRGTLLLLIGVLRDGMPLAGFLINLPVIVGSGNWGSEWLSMRCQGFSCLESLPRASLLLLWLLLLWEMDEVGLIFLGRLEWTVEGPCEGSEELRD